MKHKLLILSSMVLGTLAAQPVLAAGEPNPAQPSLTSVDSQDRTTERADRSKRRSDMKHGKSHTDAPATDSNLPQQKNAVPTSEQAPATRDEVKSDLPNGPTRGELPKGDTTSAIKRPMGQ